MHTPDFLKLLEASSPGSTVDSKAGFSGTTRCRVAQEPLKSRLDAEAEGYAHDWSYRCCPWREPKQPPRRPPSGRPGRPGQRPLTGRSRQATPVGLFGSSPEEMVAPALLLLQKSLHRPTSAPTDGTATWPRRCLRKPPLWRSSSLPSLREEGSGLGRVRRSGSAPARMAARAGGQTPLFRTPADRLAALAEACGDRARGPVVSSIQRLLLSSGRVSARGLERAKARASLPRPRPTSAAADPPAEPERALPGSSSASSSEQAGSAEQAAESAGEMRKRRSPLLLFQPRQQQVALGHTPRPTGLDCSCGSDTVIEELPVVVATRSSGSFTSRRSSRQSQSAQARASQRRMSFLQMTDDTFTRLSQNFKTAADTVKEEERIAQEAVSTFDVITLARTLKMTVEEVKQVQHVFEVLDLNGNGSLEFREFQRAVVLLIQEQSKDVPQSTIKALCKAHWARSDRNTSGSIDLEEFLRWWSANRFREELLLSQEERKLRALSRKHNVTVETLESIKQCFDKYDSDGSGIVDRAEFRNVLYKVMRVPPGAELPDARVRQLWQELDSDGSGTADFEEFLRWWLDRKSSLLPYEDFYQRIRCLRELRRDPPAYA